MNRPGLPTVLVITPDFAPARGGIQLMALRVASLLRRVTPTVVTLGHPGAAVFDAHQAFEIRRSPQVALRPATILGLNGYAAVLAMAHRPSVVLSMHVVTSPAAALARRMGVPFLQVVYGHEFGSRPSLSRFAVTSADRVVAISRHTRGLALAAGAQNRRTALVHPGVDLPRPDPGRSRSGGPPTILTIARLGERYKGHDVILRALPLVRARVPDVRWRIVGDGPLRAPLEDRCRSAGLAQAVDFLGPVGDDERDREYHRANVFCMVSRLDSGGVGGEGFGIVYLEAGAHGVPVVAGGVGGATDAVIHEGSGLLVDPEDHLAVADALVRVLTDRRLADRLGQGGRRLGERSSWTATAESIEDELLSLLA